MSKPRRTYQPPHDVKGGTLVGVLAHTQRGLGASQLDLIGKTKAAKDIDLWIAGDLELLQRPCVSVVGTRKVSSEGKARARRLARELVASGVVVVSGLAEGVDYAAHKSAIEAGGSTVAVIGTPITQAYPAKHKFLQEEIYQDHLLISQFKPGSRVFPSNFPQRNRVMAACSDATVIVEASESSGTVHQAAECVRLGRALFIMRSLVERKDLTWPKDFIRQGAVVLESTEQVVEKILA